MNRALMTICDRNYLPGAIALLTSVGKYHPEVSRYCFVPEEDAPFAEATLGQLAEVRCPDRLVRGVPRSLQALEAKLQVSRLPHDVVAVVDADVVFCARADELWNVEPGSVRAVPDIVDTLLENVPPAMRDEFQLRYPQLWRRQPFNAGVFSLWPKDWPDLLEDFESELCSFEYDTYSIMFDQIFLNVLLMNDCKVLPPSYNTHVFCERIPADCRLLHFSCTPKPWNPKYARWHPEYYYWARHGSANKSPMAITSMLTRYHYVQLKNLASKLIRRSQVLSRIAFKLGFRPVKQEGCSFWETSIQAPYDRADSATSPH